MCIRDRDEGFALGVNGTPAFFIDGFPISGAQPFDLFDYAVGLAEAGTLADAYVQSAEAAATPVPSGPVEIDTSAAFSIGAADAPLAAEAARCAGDQDAFLEMHHALFDRQGEWSGRADADQVFAGFAGELGLDEAGFSECLASGQYTAAVQADLDQGIGLGINGTPAFFLNGNFISGAQPYSVFQQAIESLLAES